MAVLAAADAAHLLRRAGFGPSPAEVDALTGMDVAAAVARVLDTSAAPPAPLPPGLGGPGGDDWTRYVTFAQWWIERMRLSPCPIQEKVALMWHGHFCSSLDKCALPALAAQNQLFRQEGLGSFVDLTQAVALDPAMLRYLDNADNVAGAPNENFARELMELFTLGVGHYTQADVVASARAWTGYGLSSDGLSYVYDPAAHDGGPKTFFGTTAAWTGPQVVTEILTGSTARVAASFIATKVWSSFAYPRPEPSVVSALTADFLASGLDVTALLRSILTRPEFYGVRARTALVRSPIEYVAAALRAAGISAADGHPEWWLGAMGQAPLHPPDVAGWGQNGYWISAAAHWARAGFARYLTWLARDAGMLAGSEGLAPSDAVARALAAFGVTAPAPATTAAMVTWLQGERTAGGGAEVPNLITLSLLSPDFQVPA